MTYNDTISDLITRIRNGCIHRLDYVCCVYSNPIIAILNVLYTEGFIRGYSQNNYKEIVIYLKYYMDRSAIAEIVRISKPGRRIYYNNKNLLDSNALTQLYILSTSKGIMSSTKALKSGLGGEVLFKIL